jgi:hypothetical protein
MHHGPVDRADSRIAERLRLHERAGLHGRHELGVAAKAERRPQAIPGADNRIAPAQAALAKTVAQLLVARHSGDRFPVDARAERGVGRLARRRLGGQPPRLGKDLGRAQRERESEIDRISTCLHGNPPWGLVDEARISISDAAPRKSHDSVSGRKALAGRLFALARK